MSGGLELDGRLGAGREEFEAAIWHAVRANPKSGHKWKPLQRLFAAAGYRGTGAIVDDPHQLSNRIAQLFAVKAHPGYESRGPSEHAVFIFSDQDLEEKIVPALNAQWQPDTRSVLVLQYCTDRVENRSISNVVPDVLDAVLLLTNGQDDALTRQYRDWYPAIAVLHVDLYHP